nr:hypothetical protein [Chloroflexus sp.]
MTRQPTIPLTPVSRRGLLGALVAGAGALAAASVQAGLPASIGKSADTIDVLSPEEALAAYEAEIARLRATKVSGTPLDHLERMRADLLRALAKPVAERRWVMVIDLRACVGCQALYHRLCSRKQTASRCGLPTGNRRRDRSLPQCHAPLHSPAMYAVRQSTLHRGLPGLGYIHQRAWCC